MCSLTRIDWLGIVAEIVAGSITFPAFSIDALAVSEMLTFVTFVDRHHGAMTFILLVS